MIVKTAKKEIPVDVVRGYNRKSRVVLFAICYGAGMEKARKVMLANNPRMPARKRVRIIHELFDLAGVQ